MRHKIYCPVCAAAGIKRWLLEAGETANGPIYPYCKGCKRNVLVELRGGRPIEWENLTF